MSGILALYREAYGFYWGNVPPRSLFWSCVWAAFVISAFLAWLQEHQTVRAETKARELAENALNETAPRLFLEYSQWHASQFMQYSGLLVRNSGKQQAFKVELSSDKIHGLGLSFREVPIQHVDPEILYPIGLTAGRDRDGVFHPGGGPAGGQLDRLFDDLVTENEGEVFPVTIKYNDYNGKIFETVCVIKREGWPGQKRIWCELA